MSVCFVVRLRPESSSIDLAMDGRALALNEGSLSARCEDHDVTPVIAFVSPDAAQQREFLDSHGMRDVPVAPESWFDPRQGLATFRTLVEVVAKEREWFQEVDLLLADLRRIIEILAQAEAAGQDWNLDICF